MNFLKKTISNVSSSVDKMNLGAGKNSYKWVFLIIIYHLNFAPLLIFILDIIGKIKCIFELMLLSYPFCRDYFTPPRPSEISEKKLEHIGKVIFIIEKINEN